MMGCGQNKLKAKEGQSSVIQICCPEGDFLFDVHVLCGLRTLLQ